MEKAWGMPPAEVVEEIRTAHLRGRGGSGFPAAVKWDLVLKNPATPKYVIGNGNEDEPGTFKDRYLLLHTPHQVIEGLLIAAHAVGAEEAILYVNGRFADELAVVEKAVTQAREAGYWGDRVRTLRVARSPGVYIGGEETALLEVLEGRSPVPREKPPFYPATRGLFGRPTLVNNVETLANVPHIVLHGAAWYTRIGPRENHGTRIFCLSGDVERPGLYELPMGIPLRTLIEDHGGGVKGGQRLKAVFPGGPSFGLVRAEDLDIPLDFDSLKGLGSGLGTAGMIVVGESTCLVETVLGFTRFFARGSCGQCPPCRLGTAQLAQILERIEAGRGQRQDLDLAVQLCRMIDHKGICHLVNAATQPILSSLRHFRGEYEAHLEGRGCPFQEAKLARELPT